MASAVAAAGSGGNVGTARAAGAGMGRGAEGTAGAGSLVHANGEWQIQMDLCLYMKYIVIYYIRIIH